MPGAMPETQDVPDHTPVVLLHGLTSGPSAWDDVIPHLLGRGRRVLVPSLAGHRGGRPLAMNFGESAVEAMTRILVEDLAAEGVGQAVLVGNSLGGWLALELARRGVATRVIAFSPAGAWGAQRDLDRLVRLFTTSTSPIARETVRRLVGTRALRGALMRPLSETAHRMPLRTAYAILDEMRHCTAIPALLSSPLAGIAPLDPLPCPVDIVWSEHDRVLPPGRYALPLLERLPAARFSVLPGAGHVPMYDRPRQVAELVLDRTGAAPQPRTPPG